MGEIYICGLLFWIFIILMNVHGLTKKYFTSYNTEEILNDVLCLSSATKFTGLFPSVFICALRCQKTDGCMGFYYDSLSPDCYGVDTVITTDSGCEDRQGVKYFIKGNFGCYNYTQEDQNQMQLVPEQEQCESYPFHVYTGGDNQAYGGCSSSCNCCAWKGCYSNVSRDYSGTWSQTRNGRLCQRWDSQYPHEHTRNYISGFPQDASVYDAHNYCRDPDNEGSPWCYTVDPTVRWEFCGVEQCWST